MPLETSTFLSGLTETWPVTGDPKSQGDDHLRLIKSVLKATFPTGSKAFYFPTTTAVSGTITLTAADQNNVVEVTTTSGNVTVNLPSTLGVGDKGWSCDIVKVSNDMNAAIVTPASGTISSKCAATATIRVGILCEPATMTWNGTSWRCSKPGPMIGSTENFDGPTVPAGYLLADGSVFSNTLFAELFAVLGSSTLRDKRGRVEAGIDGGVGRLTAAGFGGAATLGSVGGAIETVTLSVAQLPAHTHANTLTDPGHFHSFIFTQSGLAQAGAAAGTVINAPTNTDVKTTGITINNASVGSGSSVPNVQPTMIVNKIVRAC